MKVSGSSTITYQWVPPNNAAGQPDLTNFPAPPLYILGRIDAACSMSGDPGQGVTGNGSLSDGWGWGWSVSASMVPFSLPVPASDSIRRKVLPVGMGSPAVFTMSPGGYVAAYRGGTEGEAQGGITIDEYVYPITLASPNPLTNPLLGDGSNQYVYETSQPNGQLTVPASVYVPGASTPDTTFLLPHVSLSVSPAMQTGAQPFTWMVSDAGLYVNTTGARPGYTSGWPSGDFCYIGLPPDNSYFGNHVMAMKVDGQQSQIANYQLFYTATASNYPQAGADYTAYGYFLPNWFNYFEQAFPNSTGYDPNLIDMSGKPFTGAIAFAQCLAYYDTSVIPNRVVVTGSMSKMNAGALTIGNAPSQGRGIPVFEISSSTNYLDYLGELYVKGIYNYLYVDGHEQEHIALQTSNDCFIPASANGNVPPPNPPKDTDGDWIPDAVEAKYHLNVADPDRWTPCRCE